MKLWVLLLLLCAWCVRKEHGVLNQMRPPPIIYIYIYIYNVRFGRELNKTHWLHGSTHSIKENLHMDTVKMWLWTGDQPQTRRSPQPPPIINWKITQQRSQETLNLPSDLGLQSRSYPMLSNRLTSPTHTLSFSRPNLTGHQSAGHPHLRMLGVLASRKPVQHPTGGDDEVWLRVLSKWLAFLMTITAAQKSSRDLHVDGASSEKIGCPEQVLSSCTFSDLVTFCGQAQENPGISS